MESKLGQAPLVLIEYGDGELIGQKHSLYNVVKKEWAATTIPILFDQNPLPCNYGWVVVLNPFTNTCSLWNPKSTEIIQLPELKSSSIYSQCVLSKPPTESGCRILFRSASMWELAFCQIGDDEFVEKKIAGDEDVQYVMAMKSFRGDIYSLIGFGERLVTISFMDKALEFRPVLDVSPSLLLRPWSNYEKYYLVDDAVADEMLLVCKMSPASYLHQFSDFKVFRIDFNTLECVELRDIGERTIFVAHNGDSFCRSSIQGIKQNSIYYTHVTGNVQVYNLDNRGTTRLPPCRNAPTLSTTYWIEESFP